MAFISRIMPGVSLTGTSSEQISQSINTRRNIVIEISNYSSKYKLGNPRVYTKSGYCLSPPQPTIQKKTKEVCTFTKTSDTACGAVGVLTYQILTNEMGSVGELAIMFSVPHDYRLYENWFAFGIFTTGMPCNEYLFKQMYYDPSTKHCPFTRGKGTGSEITYCRGNISVKGTMSPAGKSIMKVEFHDWLS
ncbi:DELTA-sagatoxin-Srs1a-like [Electrophorus electricus]|uniref:Actinoporin-like protein n=1 Tax=Electrophorus electricus TaxID=8005 RepID=A0A4W4FDS5_ELEEL|nr:DELTA-sagatoxin-Srs1a-like [Electrophorus electricus]